MRAAARHLATVCVLCVVSATGAAATSPAGVEPVTDLEFLGVVTIPTGARFEDTLVGGLSGITYDAELGRYYAISDDPSSHSPARFYTLRIDLSEGRLKPGGVEIEAVTVLTDRRGEPFAERLIDGESIVLTPKRTLLVSSEGNIRNKVPPSIREVRLDGRETHEFHLPTRWLAKTDRPWGARHNNAFESLAVLPDREIFFTATENALQQDGPDTDVGRGSRVRIARVDARSGRFEAEYVYLVDPVVSPPVVPDAFRTNGLVDLEALDERSFLALERSFSLGVGNSVRLFLVSTEGADDVRQIPALAEHGDVVPASKRLLADLRDLDFSVDNLEGLTFGPRLADGRRTLVLVSDDNFSPLQVTQILAFAVGSGDTSVHAIQGESHRSALEGRWLAETLGVVTVVGGDDRRRGFWIQCLEEDDRIGTSEGLFVSPQNGTAAFEVGDLLSVGGRVEEAGRPNALTVTRLIAHRIDRLDRGQELPAPVRLGGGGRQVPATIDDDELQRFDPEGDAIDFFESLEGMRVTIDDEDAIVAGPTTRFGTLTVAVGDGDGSQRTFRGGPLLGDDDANAERLSVDGSLVGGVPGAEVGQRLASPLVGILDYAFGDFRLVASERIDVAPFPGALDPDRVARLGPDSLTVATYNVENLDVRDPDERFERIAGQLARLRPALVALQEIQDDSGEDDDGTVSAVATLERLVDTIRGAGGPGYRFVQLDPLDNADGGAPGGNIRVAFLYDPSVLRMAPGARFGDDNPVRLFERSPAFIENPATGFEASRKPLAAEFLVGDRRLTAINVHLKSKRGDEALFGPSQPPARRTEVQRQAQVHEVGKLVSSWLEKDPAASVIVLGDFNEHEFRAPMRLFSDYGLTNLVERVPADRRYSYNYGGNSQMLDHILVSAALAASASDVEILHDNADYPYDGRAGDHDLVVATFDLIP